ncbi:hypothetical protein [Maioricimonas sp. JC845]
MPTPQQGRSPREHSHKAQALPGKFRQKPPLAGSIHPDPAPLQ